MKKELRSSKTQEAFRSLFTVTNAHGAKYEFPTDDFQACALHWEVPVAPAHDK